MNIHCFQHVPFEGLGNIEGWIAGRGHSLSRTLFFQGEKPPRIDDIDWLIVMGGPMGVYEKNKHPWLAGEIDFIEAAIKKGKRVLGICLGAQLIAAALGAKVYPNKYKEIGWFPITLTPEGKDSRLLRGLPAEILVYHWHGDTFDLPPGAIHLAESAACRHQAFSFGERVLALQFHLDVGKDNIEEWTRHGQKELIEAPYIQKVQEMLAQSDQFDAIEKYMHQIMDDLEAAGK